MIIQRLLRLWAWLCGLLSFSWTSSPRPSTRRTSKHRTLRHLPVQVFPQTTPYSCTASTYQSAFHFLTGEVASHEEAIQLLKCCPNGAHLKTIASALRRKCGARPRKVKTLGEARRALRSGRIVISCDDLTWGGPHAVLMVGATRKGCYLTDSNVPTVRWKNNRFIRMAADEFIVVERKPRTRSKRKR